MLNSWVMFLKHAKSWVIPVTVSTGSKSYMKQVEGTITFMKGSNSTNLITMIERKTPKILIAKNDNKSRLVRFVI